MSLRMEMQQIDDITEEDIVDAMKKYGGGFIKSLADTYCKADSNNKIRIKNAFVDYWEQYKQIATDEREKENESD